jgi:N-acetylmuramoyl-L-alanine amidase
MSNFPSRFVLGASILFAGAGLAEAADKPTLVTRSDWQAKTALPNFTKHTPKAILIHHTATKMKPNVLVASKMKSLQRFSQNKEKLADGRMKPAWTDVPYHFYIASDGKIAEGRDINVVGDTNTGYDPSGYIQIVVEGNFETETPKAEQVAALKTLLAWLKQSYKVQNKNIGFHGGVAQTACPGKNLKLLLPDILKAVEN